MERLRAIVTAGGTAEPIDDVRAITNFSTGRFGHALAAELAGNNTDTVELCPSSTVQRLGREDGVRYEHFDTTDSLRHLLVERTESPDIILHAAAVSDYRPVRSSGKLSSEQESLTIQLERTPKIISELRERYGSEAFIAGFKLLSGVSEAQLVSAAMAQLKLNRLNMVLANDLQHLKDGQHPLLAVTAEGGVIPFEGERAEVARELARFILRRVNVQWFRSVGSGEAAPDEPNAAFADVLSLTHDMHLLTDESGNISVNEGEGRLLVSPRQVDKSALSEYDVVPAAVNTDDGIVTYAGDRKPSIDTGVSALLYHDYPDVEAIIHFHTGWGRMNAKTSFPFPCGVKEEADEMISSLRASGSQAVALELVHHGFLLGLKAGDRERLSAEWSEVKQAFNEHLDEVGRRGSIDESLLRPIFDGLSVAGIIYDRPDGAAVFIRKEARGSMLGKRIVEQLIKRQYTIQTADDCNVRDYYKKYGFREQYGASKDLYVLTPPARQLQREF